MKRRKDYTPVRWDKYFQGEEDIKVRDNVFRLYTAGKEGPVLLLLHGGGHCGLSWAVFTAAMMELCNCRILAMDVRGHGHTKTADSSNLAADVLARDVADVIDVYFHDDPPPIVMLGHSMGGAIAVHVAASKLLKTLVGLVVIDVVEGTALEALSAMDGFLQSRPKAFKSIEEAIEWSIRSNQVRNLESAKVSIPGQLYRCPKGKLEHMLNLNMDRSSTSPVQSLIEETISEEELGDEIVIKEQDRQHEQHEQQEQQEQSSQQGEQQQHQQCPATENIASNMKSNECEEHVYTWRIDLTRTEIYWKGWFQDMSKLFLSSSVPKLLILAGIDRLDKDLTIGQMQGKFQMHVLPNCGHTVHEDAPDKVAELMVAFLQRHKLATPKNIFQRHMPSC
eukprot:Seg1733.1 transcript_id=Seg1733.1/GoldUCD/mRNA.D3Y31 product="Protein phosphatase methylesterase 1" protein_id=Seg1733.1/GoldUCD/D3Y31